MIDMLLCNLLFYVRRNLLFYVIHMSELKDSLYLLSDQFRLILHNSQSTTTHVNELKIKSFENFTFSTITYITILFIHEYNIIYR